MRGNHGSTAMFQDVFNRGNGFPYAVIIRYILAFIQRHIEIRADKNRFTLKLHPVNIGNSHGTLPSKYFSIITIPGERIQNKNIFF
jgi:hypothetical protein